MHTSSFYRLWIVLGLGCILTQTLLLNAQESPVMVQVNQQLLSHSQHPEHMEAELGSFLMRQFPFLRLPAVEVSLVHHRQSPGGRYYTFQQKIGGIPIYRQQAKVQVSHTGILTTCISQWTPIPSQPNLPHFGISPQSILDRFYAQPQVKEVEISPFYLWKNEKLVPVYQVIVFSTADPPSWEILIDASQGQELQREVRALFHTASSQTDTSGRARVFLPDPCTKAEVGYGDLFVDDNDAHHPIFDNLMDTVTLEGLTYENGQFLLKGPYVSIEDIDPNEIPPAQSSDGNFFFTRDQSGFEDVMAYYHIDRMQRYVQSLGFFNLQNRPLRVDPHGFGNVDKSSFVPNGEFSYLKFGEGGVDDAEDADVLIHEYAHALSYAAAPETVFGFERRSLDEGYGDYFAAAYSIDLNPFRWEEVFNWDGHNPFFSGRSASSSLMYPPNSTSIYTWGEVWASMLMQIRNEIGGEVTDRLVLQAMYGSVGNMSFVDATQLLLEADTLLYGGIYSETVGFYACQRGILEGGNCLSVSNPAQISGVAPWKVIRGLQSNQYRIEFSQGNESAKPHTLLVTNMLGQRLWNQQYSPGQPIDFQLPSTGGLYFIQLAGNEKSLGHIRWLQP